MASPDEDVVQQKVFVKGHQVYKRPTTIQHWQLRDLVSAADNEEEFYCVCNVAVYKFNATTRQSTVACHLDFSATSMTVAHGFLAAGGLHGELLVQDLSTQHVCFHGAVADNVNNAVHIGLASDGNKRLFVCGNDRTIKVYKLPSMESITEISCPRAINYCALSKDGRYLVAVGDLDQTLLYQATATGYTVLSSFTEAGDPGMCCAWNHYGSLFGDCHQDGTVAVWDPRSGACVFHHVLLRPARCMKFSAAPLDLLAVSEQEEQVSIVDTRKWSKRQKMVQWSAKESLARGAASSGGGGGAVQVLRLDPPASPGTSPGGGGPRELAISGVDFTPSGQGLWIGLEECCMSYEVDTVQRRTFSTASMS